MPYLRLITATLALLLVPRLHAFAVPQLESVIRADNNPDPSCSRGVVDGSACCASFCGTCGGNGCHKRPGGASSCCVGSVSKNGRNCAFTGPPCNFVTGSRGGVPPPKPPVNKGSPVWQTLNTGNTFPTARHEACFVMVNGKGYLMGGRGKNPVKPVDIFDPATNRWKQGARPNIELHHMQCVAYGNEVWIVSSWTGGFPREKNTGSIYIYNTLTNSWYTRPGLPESRRRGGGAAVLYNNRIYVVGGNRGGHGAHATTLGWMDYYDIGQQKWVTNLKPLPDPRDHVGGGVVNGNKLCIAGGRDGGSGNFFFATKSSTYCYTFSTDTWQNMNAPFPAPRGGASYGTTCAGHLMIAGGERSDAFSQVDVFNGRSWTTTASLQRKRHGSGLAVSHCSCGKIYIASGSGSRGGSPELTSTEVYLPKGDSSGCAVY